MLPLSYTMYVYVRTHTILTANIQHTHMYKSIHEDMYIHTRTVPLHIHMQCTYIRTQPYQYNHANVHAHKHVHTSIWTHTHTHIHKPTLVMTPRGLCTSPYLNAIEMKCVALDQLQVVVDPDKLWLLGNAGSHTDLERHQHIAEERCMLWCTASLQHLLPHVTLSLSKFPSQFSVSSQLHTPLLLPSPPPPSLSPPLSPPLLSFPSPSSLFLLSLLSFLLSVPTSPPFLPSPLPIPSSPLTSIPPSCIHM